MELGLNWKDTAERQNGLTHTDSLICTEIYTEKLSNVRLFQEG